ncbi:MAG: SRPBCC family protein [Acidimicrobiia bacterium]
MADSDDVVTVERVIPAPPEKIFELLANPDRHREIDGSGTVRDPTAPAERLKLGSTFDMKMKMGVPYTMTNTVVEFEDGRKIAWQPRPKRMKRFGGRIWRYELEPVDGGTRVRESWDISEETGMKSVVRKGGKHTATNMEKTLERIEQIVT